MSSPHSPRMKASWVALVSLAIVLFLMLTGYRVDRPGLYADEMLFAPPIFELLGECEVDAQVSVAIGDCTPLYLNPPYLGTLKTWLYAPILALLTPSTAVMRWPTVLLAALILIGWAWWLRREFGLLVSAAACVAMALDPAFAIHARMDWGPAVLAGALKLALLAAVWAWLARGSTRALLAAGIFAAAGIYDKLSFIWVVGALAGAVLMIYPDRVVARLRQRSRRYWACVGAVGLGPASLIVYMVVRATNLAVPGADAAFELSMQWERMQTLISQSLSAAFVRPWIAGLAAPQADWPLTLLLALPMLLLLVAGCRPWRDPLLRDRFRATVFLCAFLLLMMVAMLSTRQLGGAQHIIALWPLPIVCLLLLIDLFARALISRFAQRGDGLRVVGLGLALAVLMPLFAQRHLELRQLWQGAFGFTPRFDPAIEALAAELATRPAVRMVATDWGLYQPLVVLTPADIRARLVDGWTAFNDPPGSGDDRKRKLYDKYLHTLPLVFVRYAPGRAVMPNTEANFDLLLGMWSLCRGRSELLVDATGRPLYELVWIERNGPCEH